MILGVGCDIVENRRFHRWESYEYAQLRRLYHDTEITFYYDLATKEQRAAFLASRFALKEALYKAVCAAHTFFSCSYQFSFRRFVPFVWSQKITKEGLPLLQVAWSDVWQVRDQSPPQVQFSLSHA